MEEKVSGHSLPTLKPSPKPGSLWTITGERTWAQVDSPHQQRRKVHRLPGGQGYKGRNFQELVASYSLPVEGHGEYTGGKGLKVTLLPPLEGELHIRFPALGPTWHSQGGRWGTGAPCTALCSYQDIGQVLSILPSQSWESPPVKGQGW